MKALERFRIADPSDLRRRLVTGATTAWLMAVGVAFAATPGAGVVKGAADLQDIHDIRPPFHIPRSWIGLAVVAGCCVLAALIVAGWRWRQRRLAAARKSAHELALERLAAARALMLPEQARAFSIAVSGIIRSYIEARFDIRAAQRTTPEFLRDCVTQANGSLVPHRQRLEEFMKYCDLAKFARWVLSVPEMEAMLASGIAFVSATATVPPMGHRPAPQGGQLVSQPEATST